MKTSTQTFAEWLMGQISSVSEVISPGACPWMDDEINIFTGRWKASEWWPWSLKVSFQKNTERRTLVRRRTFGTQEVLQACTQWVRSESLVIDWARTADGCIGQRAFLVLKGEDFCLFFSTDKSTLTYAEIISFYHMDSVFIIRQCIYYKLQWV